MLKPNDSIGAIAGIGSRFRQLLGQQDITAVGDLFYYFPYRFIDFSCPTPIAELAAGRQSVIAATVTSISSQRTARRHMLIVKALLEDASGSVQAVWFNQPFIAKTLAKGSRWHILGKLQRSKNFGTTFAVEQLERQGVIVPVYHECEGITSKWFRLFIAKSLPALPLVQETLPPETLAQFGLVGLKSALASIHSPPSGEALAQARRRLAIEELLPIMLRGKIIRRELGSQRAPAITIDKGLLKQFVGLLPFQLTADQRAAAWQIIKDMARPRPMNRLLQGEVGSGKTVVAAMAVLGAAQAGYTAIWLAPTEILAQQHYQTIGKLLATFDVKIGIWTAGTKQNSEADLVIGTHALLNEHLTFPRLAFVIVDEQHRFGVRQRARLRQASARQAHLVPHFLSMTATPIPRTLSLTLWGDLDLTLIGELPQNRQPIVTRVIDPAKRADAYGFVGQQVKAGRQVFVITPLIEEQKNKARKTLFAELERKSAMQEFEKLSKEIFPNLRVGLLHGKMPSQQKNVVMADFREHKLDILVSTAVVEVGIDVPNATVMMIEGAEHFGLAQLHQLRGRVGRGEHASYCLVLPESEDAAEHRRLQAMVGTTSGLKLAEYDLKFRGPGELFGRRQHGVPDLQMASLADSELIAQAQTVAQAVFEFGLERLPELNKKVEKFERVEHLE